MPRRSFRFEAIGTFFEIVSKKTLSETHRTEILASVDDFDRQFSRFRDDSVVAVMAKRPGVYVFAEPSKTLLEYYEALYKITKGKVTPLIGGSLEALGYDAKYSLKQTAITPAPLYQETVERLESSLKTSEPVVFDVGAAGKGYLVDMIAAYLQAHGMSSYTIDASGDLLHKGDMPEQVGLEDPLHSGKVIGEIVVHNKALCASATNRRQWGNGLHHIVNPSTGLPEQSIMATWVLADSAMIADGLATALFFVEPEVLRVDYNYEYMRVHADGMIDFSRGFEGALY